MYRRYVCGTIELTVIKFIERIYIDTKGSSKKDVRTEGEGVVSMRTGEGDKKYYIG